ncbi:AAA family ATPase [Ideonella sp.]|uniref:AAA family ATPase n=1 Tax=Ideonella sp. TaxID=1929293 RepID=UPI003BB5D5F5
MSSIYRRTDLAAEMARRLVHPGVLDEGLRSGLFLSGLRRTGKTTFLMNDLIPALEQAGALVIYVDLWSDTQSSPATLVRNALRKTLSEVQNPASSVLARLARLRNLDVSAFGFKFAFKVEQVGAEGGTTLAEAIKALVEQAQTTVVLIVDEVQHAITTEEGNQLLLALKAARDAINPRPGTPGYFIFVGTGSHRALVSELTARRNQAFAGATSVPYPVLEGDYVNHLLQRLQADGLPNLPSLSVATQAFKTLGHRPEEMIRAMRQLVLHLPPGAKADEHLPTIAATLRATAADLELSKLEPLGSLAVAVFDRIAMADGDVRRLYSNEAAADYAQVIGREVRVDEVQPIVNELLAANLIMRRGHGAYGITDPFVQEIWRERKQLLV